MVQVMVEVRSGRWQEHRLFQLLECTTDTGIAELKQRAEAAAAAGEGLLPPAPKPTGKPAELLASALGQKPPEKAAAASAVAEEEEDTRPRPPPREARQVADLELLFMSQTCEDAKALYDYGVCHDWIRQVAGFVLQPKGTLR